MPVVEFGSLVVYVGRGTPLGNNYHIGTHGTRETVIGKYRRWLWNELKDPSSKATLWFEKLVLRAKQGKILYLQCSCAPKGCHADILKRAIEWRLSQQKPKPQMIYSKRHECEVECITKKVPFKKGNGFHIGAYAVSDGKFIQWVSHK
jgi:hypothetical protein